MAINAGDAVFHFLGDTTNLDQAYAKVNSGAAAAVAPAVAEVKNLGDEFQVTAAGAKKMGEVTNLAGEEAKFSMYEAKGEAALLGEQIGIKLPRHIQSFVAELPGVGQVLTSAFSGTAVLVLTQLLIEGTTKLTEWVSETFIFTEATKQADKANTEFNLKVVEHNKRMKELTETYRNLFITGPEKLAHDVTKLSQELTKLNKQLEEQEKSIHKVSTELTFWEKAQVAVGDNVSALGFLSTKVYHDLAERQEEAAHAAELATQVTKNQIKEVEEQRKIAAKEASDALKKQAQEYGVEASNAVIRFTKEFEARKKLRDLLATPAPDVVLKPSIEGFKALTPLVTGATEEVDKLIGAYKQLGLLNSIGLAGDVKKDKEAIDILKQAGASTRELLRAKLALVNAEIKLAQAENRSTDSLEKQRKIIITQLNPAIKAHEAAVKQAADGVGHAILSEAYAWGQGAATIGQAARQITATIIQEVAKQAEVKGAAKLAEAIGETFHNPGAAAADYASAAAWFALAGGVSAAAGAVSGGPSGPVGSVNNPVATVSTPSPAESPAGRSAVVVAQSFAGGGLVSGPTLSVIGDSIARSGAGKEAAIPLDDPSAVKDIVKALGGGGTHFHVKGDLIDHSKLLRRLSNQVKQGKGRLVASDSFKTTRRA